MDSSEGGERTVINWIRRSFKNRIFTTVLLVTLVPLLLCNVLMMKIVVRRSETALETQAQQEMSALSDSWNSTMASISTAIDDLCDSTVVRSALRQSNSQSRTLYQLLYRETRSCRSYGRFGVYDAGGQCLYSTDSTYALQAMDTSWGVLRSAGESSSIVYGRDDSDSLTVARSVRTQEGEILGYIAAQLDLDSLSALLPLSSGNDFILLDGTWRILYSSRGAQVESDINALRSQLLQGKSLNDSDDEYYYYAQRHEQSGVTMLLRQSKVYTPQVMASLYSLCAFTGVLCLALSLLSAFIISSYLSKPIQELDEAMGQVEKGRLDIQLESDRSDELGRLTSSFNRMTREYSQNLERSVQRERELNETRLSMFQAQLNPHFLYNTLDSMKWLGITNKVPQVADMATDLASLLRAAVSGNKVISLEGELELLERYLDIQSLRFGDSFTWEMDIPDCLQHCLIPKLVLQPLVENAIIHGVSDMPDGYIKISARSENNDLLLSVSDNGQGMSEELLSCLNSPDRELPEGHLGLNNVQRIVRLYYGEGYGISAKAGESSGSVVQIRLPIVKKEVEDA
jgi:two-component system sensor histidine kinase YesM